MPTVLPGETSQPARRSQRIAPFWGVWLANIVSNLGDGLYQFALPVIAFGLTASPAAVAGVTIALTLAWPLFGLQAGSIVDHFDRRRVMLWVNGGRVLVLMMLTSAIISDNLSLAVVYAAALVLGIGETMVDTALTAIVPSVVARDRLEWANGRIAAGQTVSNTFIAPPLAGGLLTIGWAVVTAVSGALYGIAVFALALLRGSYRAERREVAGARTGLAGMAEGFRFLWHQPLLRRLTLFTAAMNVWWSAWTAVFVVFALTPGPMQLNTFGYGLILTAMAVGGLIGSLLTPQIQAVLGTRGALLLDMLGTVLLVGVPAVTSSAVPVAAAVFAAGLGASVWVVVVASIRQRITPDDLLGRVYSASRLISWGVLPAGAALGGITGELLGVPALFGIGSVVSLAVLIAFVAAFRGESFEVALAPASQGADS